jgi:ABC-type phosphate transport system permease subunit
MYRSMTSRKVRNYIMVIVMVAVSFLYVTPLISIIYTAVERGGAVLVETGLRFLTDLALAWGA